MKYPEIRIKDGWLIRQNVSSHLHKLWAKKDETLANDKDMEKIVSRYQKAWKLKEKTIVEAMCDVLDLEFRQNIIDVYIAPWMIPLSDPMVIGPAFKPDEFVDTLTHELLHRLLTDNTAKPYNFDYKTTWKKMFGSNHSFVTLVHIPVHAVHKYIMLDVPKEPERLTRELEACEKHKATEYLKAWDYVDRKGYEKIIGELRKDYKNGG